LPPGERRAQRALAPRGQTFHSLDRYFHDRGDLGVRQTLDMAQHHRLTLPLGQIVQGDLQRLGAGALLQGLIGARAIVRRLGDGIERE